MHKNGTQAKEETINLVQSIAEKARIASHSLALISEKEKNKALASLANLLKTNVKELLKANAKDLKAAKASGLSEAMIDRLYLTPDRIKKMEEGICQVIELPDPAGDEIEKITRPNRLDIRKVRVPIGVIGIIYESRPNVTIDCAALCIKSGNACILRGGKEAFNSNTALSFLTQEALRITGITCDAVQFIPTTDRSALRMLLKLDQYIDCIIPRGGEGLIRFVAENAFMPVIKHYKGVCNIYVDKAADPQMAETIILNAKTQRPGVCNAVENLFIHQDVAASVLPRITRSLVKKEVELRVDEATAQILREMGNVPFKLAKEDDYYTEYLDRILSIKVVSATSAAITAVNTYGSRHSDAIITKDKSTAKKFMAGVDSSTIYWNASTRFTDGFEFGLGAEIGISTDKLHARGPMGLRELCTYKYLVYGNGQIK